MCHLTKKIYRGMLCIGRHEMVTYITMRELYHNHLSTFSWTPHYRILFSRELLGWIMMKGRVLCSFTYFITTPELSGPLYISPDIYHTQITEYLLEKIKSVSFFQVLSASNTFLIVVLLEAPFSFSIRTRPIGNTFAVLFQLKRFLSTPISSFSYPYT